MYGKVLKKSEYEIKFGAKDQQINVFICFKSLKNSISYVIFSYIDKENNGKLQYGMLHKNGTKLVSMEPKSGSEEIIKDIVWKITNNQSLDSYKIIDIKNSDKIEIISSNTIDIKPEVILKLIDLTIPKEKKEIEEDTKSNNNGCLIFIIIILILGISGMTAYDIIMKKIGLGQELICEKETSDTKINAFVNKKVNILYNRVDDFDKIIENISYKFNNYDNYNNFREKGTYYQYLSKSSNDQTGITWDDSNYKFINIVTLTENIEYFIEDTNIALKGNVDEDKAILENQGYKCTKQKREE